MDLEQLLTQAGFTILKEGISFLFSSLKDRKKAQEAEEALEGEAEVAASRVLGQEPATAQSPIQWDKVATLFWLGNDLMWIQDMMYRAADPDQVLEGIDKAMAYMRNLGFAEKDLGLTELTFARNTMLALRGMSSMDEGRRSFIQGHYEGVQKNVKTAKWYVDAFASQREPGFVKLKAPQTAGEGMRGPPGGR